MEEEDGKYRPSTPSARVLRALSGVSLNDEAQTSTED